MRTWIYKIYSMFELMEEYLQEYMASIIKLANESGVTKEEFEALFTPVPTTEEMQRRMKKALIKLDTGG